MHGRERPITLCSVVCAQVQNVYSVAAGRAAVIFFGGVLVLGHLYCGFGEVVHWESIRIHADMLKFLCRGNTSLVSQSWLPVCVFVCTCTCAYTYIFHKIVLCK